MELFRSLEPSRNNNSTFWGVSLNFEHWYLSLSSELYDCLIQGKLYSHFIEVVAFVFLLQGRALCQRYSWLWSLAGCLVTAQFVRSVAGLQKGRALRWGADVWAPGFWHEHYWCCPCWKTSLLSWQGLGEQRDHCQNRGLSVIVNWIFLIMVLSWIEDRSMSFFGHGFICAASLDRRTKEHRLPHSQASSGPAVVNDRYKLSPSFWRVHRLLGVGGTGGEEHRSMAWLLISFSHLRFSVKYHLHEPRSLLWDRRDINMTYCWAPCVLVLRQRPGLLDNFGKWVITSSLWNHTTPLVTMKGHRMSENNTGWRDEDLGSVPVQPGTTCVIFNSWLPSWAAAIKKRGWAVRVLGALKYYYFVKRQDLKFFCCCQKLLQSTWSWQLNSLQLVFRVPLVRAWDFRVPYRIGATH